ncbi:polysaccharide deacetylase family protein [Paenibacillus beijingensis]|uniref:polysaccharide deacetylase family protein n=1 Tax=Paenibacillus beijingensis TaxID=1126833 RepID=UPI000B1B08C1|nr:polysaccharide deacetylase family protein [Paenibacillus beijingensis]
MRWNWKKTAPLLVALSMAVSAGACSSGSGNGSGPTSAAQGGSGESAANESSPAATGNAGDGPGQEQNHEQSGNAGSGQQQEEASNGSAGKTGSTSSTVTSGSSGTKGAQATTATGTSGADKGTSGTGKGASGAGAAAEKKLLYKMTPSYRFKPINDEAPSKVVLLTFDDGPKQKEELTKILDALDKHNAKAIFFVNGYRVKQNPDLLTLIDERGQTIGNHSWDHIDLKKETEQEVQKQISGVQQIVKQTTGRSPQFFRPPFGAGGDTVKAIVKKEGMLFMTWSDGSLDWTEESKNKPDAVIRNVLDQLHPGANILMHELPWTADALDELLTKLEAKGYGFIDPATIDVKGSLS